MQCPKCKYIRRPTDNNPAWQCPGCGVAHAKVTKFVTDLPPEAAAETEPELVYEDKPKKVFSFMAMLGGTAVLLVGVYLTFDRIINPYRALMAHDAQVSVVSFKAIVAALFADIFGLKILHYQFFSEYQFDEQFDGLKLGMALVVALIASFFIRGYLQDQAEKRGYVVVPKGRNQNAPPAAPITVPIAQPSALVPTAAPPQVELPVSIAAIQESLVAAIANGDANAITVIDSVTVDRQRFDRSTPVKLIIKREQELAKAQCHRLRVTFRQGGDLNAYPNGRSAMSAIRWQSIYTLDFCAEGSAPPGGLNLTLEK